jgi:hypothetical protein
MLLMVFTVISLWVGYNLNWIRERRFALKQSDIGRVADSRRQVLNLAPWSLRLFGEEGAQDWLFVPEHDAARMRSLFPESTVYVWGPDQEVPEQFLLEHVPDYRPRDAEKVSGLSGGVILKR